MNYNTISPLSNSAPPSEQIPAAGAATLPCLNSNISIENQEKLAKLSTQHRKTAHILQESVIKLSARFGINHIAFLTLTFADHVVCHKEAQRRFNSLVSNVIKKRYREYISVVERQKSGRIHFHLLVVTNLDVRAGIDFDQIANKNYSSASKELRSEWLFWRTNAKNYRFGRTELLPIKSTIEAMGKYVGKYISKHIENRKDSDKGARLVRYSRGARAGTTRFMFLSLGSALWRQSVGSFAEILERHHPNEEINDIADISRVVGPRWAYHNRDFILSLSQPDVYAASGMLGGIRPISERGATTAETLTTKPIKDPPLN